ncbi:hypothetical protein ACVBEF_13265 [Glaciimonas sp. GG7]
MERRSEQTEVTEFSYLQPVLFAELTALRSCHESEFAYGFCDFVLHLENDFFTQEQIMKKESRKYVRAYRQAYAELLMLLHHAQARVILQDHHLGRKIIDLLPHWFLRNRRLA